MPTGPKGEKRPADVIGNAVKVMRILTGDEPEDYGDAPQKNQAAAELPRPQGRKEARRVYDCGASGGDCEEGGDAVLTKSRTKKIQTETLPALPARGRVSADRLYFHV